MRDVTVQYNLPATMRDGTVLRADVYRPTADGPWPVLLTRSPYGKSTPEMIGLLDLLGLARGGFIVVHQDTRGRFASDGEWEPWTFEEDDGYDTIRWAAALPGSNGAVGMFGPSYLGNTQWMAALAKPAELKAIAPAITWSEPDDGLFARGGACELGLSLPWSMLQGLDTLMRRHAGDPAALGQTLTALIGDFDTLATAGYRELPAHRLPAFVRHDIPELGFERSRQDPEWSARCRVAGRQSEVDLPSLNIGGWYDLFGQGTLDNFTAMRRAGRPAHLVMGPWVHANFQPQVGDVNFGLAASPMVLGGRGSLTEILHRWFRQWLAPDDVQAGRGEGELPPVLLYVMGINQWREEQEWPLSRAIDTPFFLRTDGLLSEEPPGEHEGTDSYVHDPADPVPTTGGAIYMSTEYRAGPLDQAGVEARPDVLVYTTEPLADDLEVTGRVRAWVHAATDAPTTDWVVRVCDVDRDGVSRNVVDGVVRVDAAPGEFSEHEVDLWSTSHVFRAGHCIRVHVTSSNFPRWDRNLGLADPDAAPDDARPARQEVAHDSGRLSRIVLPVVPPADMP